jgi:hypothetical protein
VRPRRVGGEGEGAWFAGLFFCLGDTVARNRYPAGGNCHPDCHRTTEHKPGWDGIFWAEAWQKRQQISTQRDNTGLEGRASMGLLNRYTAKTRIVGSNPIPSATSGKNVTFYQ